MKLHISLLKRIHLYLAVFFAPVLLLFTVTGALQTFDLHEDSKDGYKAPRIIHALAQVHKEQSMEIGEREVKSSVPFRWFVAIMAVGFVVTTALGIVMAFYLTRRSDRWKVYACLALGVVLPPLLLYLGGGFG